jgi:hypothetical protein
MKKPKKWSRLHLRKYHKKGDPIKGSSFLFRTEPIFLKKGCYC